MFHFPTFPPTGLYIQPAVTHKTKAMHAGFPHSDILVSPFGYQLHQAYRRFPRPSSAPIAKASTVRSCKLPQPPPTTGGSQTSPTRTPHHQPQHHVPGQTMRSHNYHDQTPHPTPKGQDATLDTIYKKMHASTIQIQSTTPRHHQPPPPPDHPPPPPDHQPHHRPPHPPTRAREPRHHLWLFPNPAVRPNHPRSCLILPALQLPPSMTPSPADQYSH